MTKRLATFLVVSLATILNSYAQDIDQAVSTVGSNFAKAKPFATMFIYIAVLICAVNMVYSFTDKNGNQKQAIIIFLGALSAGGAIKLIFNLPTVPNF